MSSFSNHKKYRFLFFFERELHLSVMKNLILYVAQNELAEIAILTVPYSGNSEGIPGRGARPEIIEKELKCQYVIVSDPYQWKPDITFLADFSYQHVEGLGKIVNIGHGTISKGWFFTENLISRRENCADLICVPGRIHKDKLNKQVFKSVKVTGMPKLDLVFSEKADRESILTRMGLNHHNKTVLLAPTFNQELSIIPHLKDKIRTYIPDFLNVIVKLHGASPEAWKNAFRQISDENEGFFFFDETDISEAMIVSDILISDVSSVIYEFSALRKPVLIFDSPDQMNYPNYDNNDLEYHYRDIGYRFSSVSKLPEMLFRGLTGGITEKMEQISEDFITIRDGSSSERIIKESISLLERHETEASIIIYDTNKAELKDYYDLYNNRYEMVIISNQKDDNLKIVKKNDKNWFESFHEALKYCSHQRVIWINSSWISSPSLPDFMMNYLLLENDIGLVVPLLKGTNNINQQLLDLNIRMGQNTNKELIGWNLTYSMTGQYKELDYAEPVCFAIVKSIGERDDYSNLKDSRLCWIELIRNVFLFEKRIVMALDCLVEYKYDARSPKTIFNKGFLRLFSETSRKKEEYSDLIGKKAGEDVIPDITNKRNYSVKTEDELKQALINNPFDIVRIRDLLIYYYDLENYDSVEVYADMIPDDPIAIIFAAKAFSRQGQIKKAKERLDYIDKDKIKNEEIRVSYLTELGNVLLKMNLFDDAHQIFSEALLLNNNHVDALIGEGSYYLLKNSFSLAEKMFRHVIMINKENIKATLGLGFVSLVSEDYLTAKKHFLDVLDRDEENIDAISGLLKCSYKVKEYEHITLALEKYLELHPANLNLLYSLAGIYYEQGDYYKALDTIEKVLIFDENFFGAQEIKDKILSKMD